MLTAPRLGFLFDALDSAPWGAACGRRLPRTGAVPLYTAEERQRRDSSPWTMVQGVLAPLQFAVFLVSLALVLTTSRPVTASPPPPPPSSPRRSSSTSSW